MPAKIEVEGLEIDIEGFEPVQTREIESQDNQGEWVTPIVGTMVKGTIKRAFLFRDEKNNRKTRPYQAGYAIQNSEGKIELISERAAYKEAIRECFLNDEICIVFTGKKDIPGSSNQEMWEVKFFRKTAKGKSKIPVLSVLNADFRRLENELPF